MVKANTISHYYMFLCVQGGERNEIGRVDKKRGMKKMLCHLL